MTLNVVVRGFDRRRVNDLVRTSGPLLGAAARKLDPRVQVRNPVLFIVWCGALLTTAVAIAEPFVGGAATSGGTTLPSGFTWAIATWLWLTLLAANLAEALAEGRGRARTTSVRLARDAITAHRVHRYSPSSDSGARTAEVRDVNSSELRMGDVVVLTTGDVIPTDGAVIWGIASVDESAITGESAPVIRESGGTRSTVTGGTRVLSDRILVRVTAPEGDTVVDRMIELAEGARRQKSANELALHALLASFSVSFVLLVITLNTIASVAGSPVSIPVLVAVVTCLIPTEIAALLSVSSIAGMYRLLQRHVLLGSGRALETAGDVTTVVLDKTGTITAGDRRAAKFLPASGVDLAELLGAAALSSLGDPTPEGTSTITLAHSYGFDIHDDAQNAGVTVPFSAYTRMSGRDLASGACVRKGSQSAILAWLKHVGSQQPRPVVEALMSQTIPIARSGGTPLVVAIKPADGPGVILGTIHLKDVIKDGVPNWIDQLRSLGIRTVMVTGDNPVTAAAIAAEVGVDDYLGDATPEDKLNLIKQEQAAGHYVAMSGDGTNEAPALAQADVGVAMNSATSAAKAAANMIVLDDDPTKLVEIFEIGRRQMATRGALTTFNIANDIVRYVALFPALFVGSFPGLAALNVLGLNSPASAILSTVIFSVVVIAVLIPLALVGVPYRMVNLGRALNWNLVVYGLGGIFVPMVGIKTIDLIVGLFPGY